jgi:hypothetical protein
MGGCSLDYSQKVMFGIRETIFAHPWSSSHRFSGRSRVNCEEEAIQSVEQSSWHSSMSDSFIELNVSVFIIVDSQAVQSANVGYNRSGCGASRQLNRVE